MNLSIQFVKMPSSEALNAYTQKKFEKLEKKYSWLIHAEVSFKVNKDDVTKGKICEAELSLPGPRIFAISNEKNFEMAVKETISDLEKQLKKRKATFSHH